MIDQVTDKQAEALSHSNGPAIILSGAGSGKTRVVACRYIHVRRQEDLPIESLLVLTHTRRAARDIMARIEALDSDGSCAADAVVDTFHTACTRILRDEIKLLGFGTNFVVYDEENRFGLIRSILKEFKIHEALFKGIAIRISRLKAEMISPEDFLADGGGFGFEEKLAKVYMRYQNELRKSNSLDMDDLVMYTVKLFESKKTVLKKYQKMVRHIMVDDFQELNPAEYRLVSLLGKGCGNVFVAADDDQGILGFRGARVEHIARFRKDFPGATTIRLEKCFRCTPCILDAAGAIIKGNSGRHRKKISSDRRATGEKPQYFHAGNEAEEAIYIVNSMRELFLTGRYSYGDFAVLYRMNSQLRPLEEALKKEAIPYKVLSSRSFYQRSEIRDALAYARVVLNPDDSVSFARILNRPSRGMGESTLARMSETARKEDVSLFEAFRKTAKSRKSQAKVKKLIDLVSRLGKAAEEDAGALISEVLEKSGYMAWLAEENNSADKLAAVKRLLAMASGRGLREILDNAVLVDDMGVRESDGVSLMTVYEAQGLEFPVVYMPGLEEGLLPRSHSRSDADNEKTMDEERRLLYVGMTRASDMLFLSGAARRRLYTKIQPQKPSRFLKELPDSLCCVVERSTMTTPVEDAPRIPAKTKGGLPFPVGARVRHVTWGAGVVRDYIGQGESAKVTVNFPGIGIKRLAIKFANLEVL